MVFYFYPRGYIDEKPEGYLIYMGKDKYENEDLIKYGLPTDLWFHVNDMSSAHVYLRLPDGKTAVSTRIKQFVARGVYVEQMVLHANANASVRPCQISLRGGCTAKSRWH